MLCGSGSLPAERLSQFVGSLRLVAELRVGSGYGRVMWRVARMASGPSAPSLDPPHGSALRLASAVMGMIDTTLELWAAGDEPMSPLLDVGFDLLDGAFESAGSS